MMPQIYVQVLGLLMAAMLVLVVLHALKTRYKIRHKLPFSGQVLIVKIVLVVNLFLFISFLFVAKKELDLLLGLIYLLFVFNAFAYMYFHFFNMSETARRIKLLIMIHQEVVSRPDQIEAEYYADKVVKNRLERLGEMGQIQLIDGKYKLTGYILLTVALLISFWKKLLRL